MEKDPTTYAAATYLWVFALSIIGGIVNFVRKVKIGESRPFNILELVGEVLTSAFAGIITFYLCEWTNIPQVLTAALVGISGHMGSRAIYFFEKWAEKRFVSVFDKDISH